MSLESDDSITLRELIGRFESFIKYLISRWLYVALGVISISLTLVLYNFIKAPSYTAKTSFVLDNESSSGLGQLSSLASLAGVNVGGLSEGGSLFQIDNIQELYRSRRMIEKTLLTPTKHQSDKLLIDYYGEVENRTNKWIDKLDNGDLDFNKPREEFTRTQDSLLMEVTKKIQKSNLIVSKPSRKLSILEVAVRHKNEFFAKEFDQILVTNVNEFYVDTRTKKARENLQLLQSQTDSVKRVLDQKIYELDNKYLLHINR